MIRLKTLLEQTFPILGTNNAPGINLNKGPGNFSGRTPGVEDGPDPGLELRLNTHKRLARELVAITFTQARKLNKSTTSASNAVAKKLHDAIDGIGSSDMLDTLQAIRTIDELSRIITSYYKLYNASLYKEISSEYATAWDSVWNSIRHLNPTVAKHRLKQLPNL